MEKRYYIYGSRPIIEEKKNNIERYYAFQWDTGEFKEDVSYMRKIFYDHSGDSEEVTKEKFDSIVQGLREKLE